MFELNKEEIAWAAGFFEGEGCFFYSVKSQSYRVQIPQMQREPLVRFDKIVGGIGRLKGPKPSNGIYYYDITSFQGAQFVVCLFWKWLSPWRKNQALTMLKGASRKLLEPGLRTHCKNGHLYSKENTYIGTNSSRQCLTCHRERQRKYRLEARIKIFEEAKRISLAI